MRASQQRATVSQDHLDRTAAIIKKLKSRKRAAKKTEKLDGIQRYAFVEMGRFLFAVPAPLGSKTGLVIGGWGHSVRVPKTREEFAAVLKLQAELPNRSAPLPDDTATIMARKIVTGAQRNPPEVSRRDFRQAGIAERDIDANFDKAMTIARRIEPRIDAMLDMPVAA